MRWRCSACSQHRRAAYPRPCVCRCRTKTSDWTDIAAARQQSRDLRYNPQRHLRQVPESLVTQRGQLVRRSRELATRDPRDHAGRRVVFREIRRVNERMLETDPWRSAEYDQRIQTLQEHWKFDRIALDREYFYALHLEHTLEQLVHKIRNELAVT